MTPTGRTRWPQPLNHHAPVARRAITGRHGDARDSRRLGASAWLPPLKQRNTRVPTSTSVPRTCHAARRDPLPRLVLRRRSPTRQHRLQARTRRRRTLARAPARPTVGPARRATRTRTRPHLPLPTPTSRVRRRLTRAREVSAKSSARATNERTDSTRLGTRSVRAVHVAMVERRTLDPSCPMSASLKLQRAVAGTSLAASSGGQARSPPSTRHWQPICEDAARPARSGDRVERLHHRAIRVPTPCSSADPRTDTSGGSRQRTPYPLAAIEATPQASADCKNGCLRDGHAVKVAKFWSSNTGAVRRIVTSCRAVAARRSEPFSRVLRLTSTSPWRSRTVSPCLRRLAEY